METDPNNEQEQSATVEESSAQQSAVQDNEIRTEADLEAAFEAMQAAGASEKENAPKEETSPANENVSDSNNDLADKTPNRIRLNELQDKDRAIIVNAVQLVRDGLASSVTEAIAILSNGNKGDSHESSVDEEAEDEPNIFEIKIAEQQREVEAIVQALTKAKEDDFDTKAEIELIQALAEAKSEIKMLAYAKEQEALRSQEREQQEQILAYETEYQQYRDEANDLYPDGSNPESQMFEEVRRTIAWFEKNNKHIFQTPNYPLAIAGIAAANLVKSGKQTNGSTPAPAKRAPLFPTGPVRGPARPTDVLVGDDATSAAANAQNVLAQLDGITNEQDLETLAEAVFAGR